MIDTKNINEARKLIEKASKENKQVIIQGKSIDFNRVILETLKSLRKRDFNGTQKSNESEKISDDKKVSMLVLSHTNKKDKLKQRDSGLNHVLCKIAKENNIILAIDMNELTKTQDKKEKAKILSRIIQNIKLIKKAKNKFKLLNYKNKQQAFSFLLTLGASTDMAKEAVS